jgi:hypothetical protein
MSNIALSTTGRLGGSERVETKSVLPMYKSSRQTDHLHDAKTTEARRTRRMLYVFALVLMVAVACALVLLISTSAAYALGGTTPASAMAGSGVTAAAALAFLTSLGAVFTVLRLP